MNAMKGTTCHATPHRRRLISPPPPRARFLLLGLFMTLLLAASLAPGSASAQEYNDPPTFSSVSFEFTVPENSPAGTQVGTVQATDPEGDALRYSIREGSRLFTIDNSGRVAVAQGAVLDYEGEDGRFFNLVVGISDGKNFDGRTDTRVDDTVQVEISVTDVDEPGEIHFNFNRSSYKRVFAPDKPLEGAWITAQVSDPDSHRLSEAKWKWEVSLDRDADDENWLSVSTISSEFIEVSGGSSHFRPDARFVGRYVRVTVSYDTGLPDLQKTTRYPVQARQRDNRPPHFGLGEARLIRYIRENAPEGYKIAAPVTATDPDGDTLRYSVVLPGPPFLHIGRPFLRFPLHHRRVHRGNHL